MAEDKRPAVMADVARLAGVSHQTVSRVVNDHPNVRPGTRERVLAAIADLAYRPNAAARTLVTRRTRMLGVISVETMLYGPMSMMYGFERAATAAHYFVSIASLPALDRRSMLDTVDRFVGQGAEGIIVIATHDSGVAALAHVPPEIPVVALGCGAHAATTSVAVDNETGAAAATAYLLGLGHRTVHLISGPPAYLDSDERVIGWRGALRAAGAAEPPVRAGDWSTASGYQAGLALARSPEVTAIFCGNDTMALGALRALTERGVRVPEDVSVIGFDDIPEAAYYMPPLTTVRQDFGDVGRRALTALLARMSGEAPAGRSLTVETSLVIRD
ncbi:MAG TPA: LacI family DNA-binding transcriptional regulator, partial [Streptosporangiaceae bacterium]|nr:LacI family DNA-binding transcriptional regulator [Streptosporangiaceae bacterium]